MLDKCLRQKKSRGKKMNCAKMIRYGFHPRGRHCLVREVGSHTIQYSTCRVVISAICIKEARAGREWYIWEKGRLHGGRRKLWRENSGLLAWEMFTTLTAIRTW